MAITQPIYQYNTIFNTAEPEELFKTLVFYIAKALNHSQDRSVASSSNGQQMAKGTGACPARQGDFVKIWSFILPTVHMG